MVFRIALVAVTHAPSRDVLPLFVEHAWIWHTQYEIDNTE